MAKAALFALPPTAAVLGMTALVQLRAHERLVAFDWNHALAVPDRSHPRGRAAIVECFDCDDRVHANIGMIQAAKLQAGAFDVLRSFTGRQRAGARDTKRERPEVTTASSQLKAPFVRSAEGALRAVLAVPPTPALATLHPVHGESSAIVERAREQFAVFSNRLAVAGVTCSVLEDGGTAQSLCADLALVFSDGAFLMRPSDLRRRSEVALVEAALARAAVPIVGGIEAPGLLDGGDVLLAGETLYIGVPRQRRAEVGIPAFVHGNALGREQLAAYARARQLRVVEVPINADVLRLRSVASLVDAETLVYAPGVVDGTAFAGLKLIEAPRGEDYGAGVLALGPRRVLANLRFRLTTPLLRKAKIAVESIDLWEFGKLGITPSLLALVLKRE